MTKITTTSATGSLSRSIAVLKILANSGERGAPLTGIVQQSGLPHPSVHRLLKQLMLEGLVQQLPSSRHYALGALAFELGLAAAKQFDIRGMCRNVIDQLADKTGESVYLVARSGSEAVCIDRREGNQTIRVVALAIGSRRPLGVGAGGLAILADLPELEREKVIQDVKAELELSWDTSEESLRELIAQAHQSGFVFIRNRLTAGVSAVGRPIRDARGRTIAAISIAAINSHMSADTLSAFNMSLERAAVTIEASLKDRSRS